MRGFLVADISTQFVRFVWIRLLVRAFLAAAQSPGWLAGWLVGVPRRLPVKTGVYLHTNCHEEIGLDVRIRYSWSYTRAGSPLYSLLNGWLRRVGIPAAHHTKTRQHLERRPGWPCTVLAYVQYINQRWLNSHAPLGHPIPNSKCKT